MARDVSIAISARDNFTQALTTMRNANQAFNHDLAGLTQHLNTINNTRATLRVDVAQARQALREAQRNFDELDDTSRNALREANENFENARRNLDLLNRAARSTERELVSLSDAQTRAENRSDGASAGSRLGGVSAGMMTRLAGAGIWNMLGQSVSGALHTGISSAFGDEAGTAISSTLSGAFSGAAMGSVAGPAGAAVGAAVGTLAGGINAAAQVFEKRDDAFREVVQNQVQTQTERQQSDLVAGSQIAANRETTLISFETLFADKDQAAAYLEQVKTMANTTPFLFDDLTQMSKVLKTYGYSPEEMIPQLTRIGDTGAALGMSTADMSEVSTAIGRMNSSGKTTLEYLNPLIERGIPAIDYLAQASGKSKEAIYEMVSKGLIPGAEAARAISDYMGKANEGAMGLQSQTFSGLQSTLQGANEEMQSAMGEGYNEERSKGIQAQIDHLSGEQGEKMSEANRLIGAYKASLENQREEMIRSAETEALSLIEQQHLSGAEAGKALMEARIQAEADYASSEGASKEAEIQKSIVNSAQSILVEDGVYQKFGYEMGQEYSKGIRAAILESRPFVLPEMTSESNNLTNPNMDITNPLMSQTGEALMIDPSLLPGAAFGIDYVPKNDYLARLHEGERVLTAQEARGHKTASAPVTVTGNNFTVREEADIYKIAQALAEELRKAQQVS